MSRMPFELLLALRYLRPKRTFVSVITLISIVGVMLGVAVLIIVISVMSGFDREWHDRILGFNAHMKVTTYDGVMENYDEVRQRVASHPRVRGVAPYILGKVLVETQPLEGKPQIDAPVLRGIDPEYEPLVSNLHTNVIFGEFDVSGNSLLVGRDLARNLDLRLGDRLAVYSRSNLQRMKDTRGSDKEVAILPDDYEVQGIFDVGFADYNALVIVTSIENAQDLYDLGDTVHGLLVMVDDHFKVHAIGDQLAVMLGPQFDVTNWTEEYSEIFGALVVEKNMIRFLLFFIVVVAAFGITSSLITFVVQKTREIGMLKALGATGRQIMSLFLGQCLIVGALGVSTGFCLGMLALAYRNEFLRMMNNIAGFELLPANIYRIYELPALTTNNDLLVICGGSLLICLLAGLIPAWIASRLKPVEALRHE